MMGAAGEGGGGERGIAKSWGLLGAGATSPGRGPDARPRPQEWGLFPRGQRTSLPALAYLRGNRIAGIKGLLGQADRITRLREEEVRRVPAALWAGASPIPGTHGLSAGSCGRHGHTELAEGGCQGNVPSASV